MCTIVNDTIHVQIKAVKFRDSVFGDELRNSWVALAHPSEEFGNTHGGGG